MSGQKITEGACLCKAVTYKITSKHDHQITGTLCHCTHCQLIGGGLCSYNAMFPLDTFEITSETKPTEYNDTGDSGNALVRCFCPKCGTHLISKSATRSSAIVKVPSFSQPLEHSDAVQPVTELFTDSKSSWEPKTYCSSAKQVAKMS